MALQFVLGGSGRGKTWYLEHKAIEEAESNPDKQYFVVVPEQFTMQTQKDMVSISKRKGVLNLEVQSFLRLAFRVFEETGNCKISVLDDMGKTMILKKVLLENEKEMGYFGKNVHKKGYVTEIKSFLAEIMQYNISEEMIQEMIDGALDKPLLQMKLQDMKKAYHMYQEYIEGEYINSEELFGVFAQIVDESQIMKGSTLYLDGFTGFTPVQYQLLQRLVKICDKVVITIAYDKRESLWEEMPNYKLFSMSQKMIGRLAKIAREQGVEVLEPIFLSGSKDRYVENKSGAVIERELFRSGKKEKSKAKENITIVAMRQPEEEVSFMLEEVMGLRNQEGFHYRDVAVIVGDMETYGHILRDKCKEVGIPCFIDQKKSILTNPAVELLRSVLDISKNRMDYESIMRYLKNEFVDVPLEDVWVAENFLLATGIRGVNKWKEEWKIQYEFPGVSEEKLRIYEEQIQKIKSRIVERIVPFYEKVGRKKHSVRQYCETLFEFMEQEKLYQKIEAYIEKLNEEEDREAISEYSQIYGILLGVLDRLVELLGDQEMNLSEFREIFETGLSEARVGMIPPGVDQVVVGDLTRTRLGDISYLFFLGMNDNYIPSGGKTGGILSESEREYLIDKEYEMAPTGREQLYTEQFYMYLMLTKPKKHLYMTFSRTAADGSAIGPAYIVDRVKNLFEEQRIQSYQEMSSPMHVVGADRGKKYFLEGIRKKWRENDTWKEIYRHHTLWEEWEGYAKEVVESALKEREDKPLSKEAAMSIYKDMMTNSVSKLEKYASCPYSYFLQYGLELRDRLEHELELFDIGNIVHKALELYTKDLLHNEKRWQDVPEEEQHILANQCINQVVEEYKNGILYDSERSICQIDEMRELMKRSVWAITKQMEKGKFETVDCELHFEMQKDISKIVGVVDRVDLAKTEDGVLVKIVDYKTGTKDVSLNDFYYGLQMQLVVYLKAAIERQKVTDKLVIPAGILYYNVANPILENKVEGETQQDSEMLASLIQRGYVSEENPVLAYMDRDLDGGDGVLAPSAKSNVISVKTVQSGELSKTAKTLTKEQFEDILNYAEETIEQFEKEIHDGRISILPYVKTSKGQIACEYCKYAGICGINDGCGIKEFRKLNDLNDETVLMKIKGEREDE